MNIFKKIYDFFKKTEEAIIGKKISKNDVTNKLLSLNRLSNDLLYSLKKLSPSDLKYIYEQAMKNDDVLLSELAKQNKSNKSLYNNLKELLPLYKKSLKKHALFYEDKTPFGAIIHSIECINDFTSKAASSVDTLLGGEYIQLDNLKLSTFSFLNLVQAFEFYLEYAMSFFGFVFKLAGSVPNKFNLLENFYKFRMEYLVKRSKDFYQLTNAICNKWGKFDIIKELESIKNSGYDIVVTKSAVPWYKVMSTKVTGVKGFINIIWDYFYLFSPIIKLGNLWNEYQHRKYLRDKEMKEWLEQHIALLKLKQQNIDPNSKQYMELAKIIERYEEILAKYDKKIKEYEEGQ